MAPRTANIDVTRPDDPADSDVKLHQILHDEAIEVRNMLLEGSTPSAALTAGILAALGGSIPSATRVWDPVTEEYVVGGLVWMGPDDPEDSVGTGPDGVSPFDVWFEEVE